MSRYLILPTTEEARARSRAAFAPLRQSGEPDGPLTEALWPLVNHPDGRAALCIPATPGEAGLSLSQAAYDGLLTSGEREALLDELPAAEWEGGDA
ncbi:hypothetical protein MWN33_13300 [Starkeya koreensis]|uniref:Uncharacterized protein n=1 Tax=Ancylobacter koreensis TaxID=266121 RepID=A0ABT0DNZ3_9HYPH|nr:hypothetical protein [Ancylobacter koreensis]MCK0209007.1 hypothetical protein [Ancylobacter koreensis]